MRKIRSLIGMPVVVSNRRIGRVIQTELTEDLSQLRGLWIDAGLRGTRFISSERLALLGQVAIMADDSGERDRCRATPLFRRAIGTDGSRLGAITGAEIDELSFRIESLELSRGIWDDLLYGREHIRHFTLNPDNGSVILGAAESEKEETDDEERYDEGANHRSHDRRQRSHDVRRHELAERQEDEPADEENRPLDRRKDG